MRTQFEDNVFKAIQDYGIVVDKEELIKALQYDRGQYEKGFADGMLAPKQSEWISVEERLPTEEENENGIVGIVSGYNGKIRFRDAIILVDYDFEEKEWWSQDYDLTDCKVKYWMPLPEPPEKGGAE
jgi:hypothetical protein